MQRALFFIIGQLLFLIFWIARTLFLVPWRLPRWFRRLGNMGMIFQDVIYCEAGHPNRAYGLWECSICGARFSGWVFGRCPVCRTSSGYFSCETCGIQIRNPLL